MRRKGTTDWWPLEELVHWVRYHGADDTACGIDCTKEPQPTYCVKPSLKDLTCPKCRKLAAEYWDKMVINQAGIKTGRLSASLPNMSQAPMSTRRPNLQNIPRGTQPKVTVGEDLNKDIERAIAHYKGEKATEAMRCALEQTVWGVIDTYVAHGHYQSSKQFEVEVTQAFDVNISVTAFGR